MKKVEEVAVFVKIGSSESESALFVNSLSIQEARAVLWERVSCSSVICESDSVLALQLVLCSLMW